MGLSGCHHSSTPYYHWPGLESKGRAQITIPDETIPLVIVGAGPIGLAAGNLLGMAGIATLILERNAAVSDMPKAIALDDEGRRICQAMGLGTAISNCIVSDLSIDCVSRGRLIARVIPDASRRNGYPLISTFYQPEFEAVLLDGLQRFSCVNLRFQHTVEMLEQGDDGVIVYVRTPSGTLQSIQCAYLLACDGGGSTIRRSLNIPLQGKTFAQKWLVIDSIADAGGFDSQPANQPDGLRPGFAQAGSKETLNRAPTVKIYCDPQRPAVSIPAPHNGRRWEFMLLPGETEKHMLEAATISALLKPRDASPHTRIIRQVVYTFHAARAKIFAQGRVFLLGDAAHMTPPFGGQGLNSGLRDAHNLAWKVAMVLREHATPQLLATYHEERSRHAARVVALASSLGTLFMSTARPLASLRNLLIQLLFSLPIVPNYLMKVLMKPRATYKAGFFLGKVVEKKPANSARKEKRRVFKGQAKKMVGSLLPQPAVITQDGQRTLLDEVLGTDFAVLRRHSNPEEAFAPLHTDFWQRLGARFVCIQIAGPYAPLSSFSTLDQPLPIVVVRSIDKDFLRACRDHYIVVRPDRFILGVFKEQEVDLFVSAFQRLLHDGQA